MVKPNHKSEKNHLANKDRKFSRAPNAPTAQRPKFPPTTEQQNAIDKFENGGSLKITAFAGAGKTSTLQCLAERRKERGLYLAFNKAIAHEAKTKFPRHVDCRTTHSIAAQFVRNTHGLSQGKLFDPISAKKLVELLGIQGLLLDAHTELTPVQLAHLLLQTSKKFCNSADTEIGKEHVDLTGRLRMTSDSAKADAIEWIVRNSQALWKRMLDANNPIPLGHDGYLKVWSLSRPKLDYGFVFVDEAQDTNPAVLSVLCNQENSQMVYVGDLHQQIYEWRGRRQCHERHFYRRRGDSVAVISFRNCYR